MSELTPLGQRIVSDVAAHQNLGEDLVRTLLFAVAEGGGRMAQFSHPALGGMGQWSQGGMVMIGDMFNNALKARVDGACSELAAKLHEGPVFVAPPGGGFGDWWPEGLGRPSTSGGQNEQRYAVFPDARRLVVDDGGQIRVYDSGQHLISGVSQQQGGSRTLSFHSQFGEVRLADLPQLGAEPEVPAPVAPAPPAPAPVATSPEPVVPAPVAAAVPSAETRPPSSAPRSALAVEHEALFAAIERLADLQARGILSPEEFTAKKAELLSRL